MTQEEIKTMFETFRIEKGLYGLYSKEDIERWVERQLLKINIQKSRCCGRCDGVNDICVTDRMCDAHNIYGCENCFGKR